MFAECIFDLCFYVSVNDSADLHSQFFYDVVCGAGCAVVSGVYVVRLEGVVHVWCERAIEMTVLYDGFE